jgi:methionyl-tRNA formyltransferase
MVTPDTLRIVYFGTPAFAVPTLRALLDSRHDIVALVSQPDRPKGRGQHLQPTPTRQLAESRGVPVLQPSRLKEDGFLQSIRDLRPDLGVVAAYGRILPDALLEIPRFGIINLHASLLPAYRGAAPVHRAVIAGDRETGVSIMRVVKELDAGPVFATARTPIEEDQTSVDIERILAELGAPLLVDVVDHISAGRAVEVPQDHERATHAPKITKEEGRIDWSLPAAAVHDLVRGLQPWPMVSIWIEGVRHRHIPGVGRACERAARPSSGLGRAVGARGRRRRRRRHPRDPAGGSRDDGTSSSRAAVLGAGTRVCAMIAPARLAAYGCCGP